MSAIFCFFLSLSVRFVFIFTCTARPCWYSLCKCRTRGYYFFSFVSIRVIFRTTVGPANVLCTNSRGNGSSSSSVSLRRVRKSIILHGWFVMRIVIDPEKCKNQLNPRRRSHIVFLQQSARLCEARRVMAAHRLLRTLINYQRSLKILGLHFTQSALNSTFPWWSVPFFVPFRFRFRC